MKQVVGAAIGLAPLAVQMIGFESPPLGYAMLAVITIALGWAGYDHIQERRHARRRARRGAMLWTPEQHTRNAGWWSTDRRITAILTIPLVTMFWVGNWVEVVGVIAAYILAAMVVSTVVMAFLTKAIWWYRRQRSPYH